MKTFKEYLSEETKKDIPDIFVHYRSGKDEKHNPHHKPNKDKDEPAEFFAHYRSGKDKKHNPESIKEDFQWDHDSASKKELSKNIDSLGHHSNLAARENKEDPDHASNVRNYTQESRSINNALIKGKKLKGRNASVARSMDRITKNPKNKLKKPIKTYSGVGERFAKVLNNTKPGGHVRSSAFISSSLDQTIARNFSDDIIDKKNDYSDDRSHVRSHIIQFHLPKGYSKARYIHDDFHANPGEHEVVIAKGQKFRKIKTTEAPMRGKKTHVFKYTAVVHHLEPVD